MEYGTRDVDDVAPDPVDHRARWPSGAYGPGSLDSPGEGVVRGLLAGRIGSEVCLGDGMGERVAEETVRELLGV